MYNKRMPETSRIVTCRGCGGSGKQGPFLPTDFPHDCPVCAGVGKVRMEPGDTWCGICGGKGKERVGVPGFEMMRTCHVCGGAGIVQV